MMESPWLCYYQMVMLDVNTYIDYSYEWLTKVVQNSGKSKLETGEVRFYSRWFVGDVVHCPKPS